MKNTLLLLLLIVAGIASHAQDKVNQTRELTGFTIINLNMPATVYVTQQDHFSVQVSAAQNLLSKISTTVEDNELDIDLDNKYDWKRNKPDVIIYVSMPKINGLEVDGSGDLKAMNDLTSDYLSLDVEGSGTIVLKDVKVGKYSAEVTGSGSVTSNNIIASGLSFELNGSGTIQSQSLMNSITSIDLAGSGEINIGMIKSEKAACTLGGSGTITISGGAAGQLLLESNGSGQINASQVMGETVSAHVSGSGGISIAVVTALEAVIAGSGSIQYSGTPTELSKSITGSGSVNKM